MNRFTGTKLILGSRQNKRYIDAASFHLIKDLVTLPPSVTVEHEGYTIETDIPSVAIYQSPFESGRYKIVSDDTRGLKAFHVEERFISRQRLDRGHTYHPNSFSMYEVFEEALDRASTFHLIPGHSFSNVSIYKKATSHLHAWGHQWAIEFREVHAAPEISEPPDDYYYFTEAIRYQIIMTTPSTEVGSEEIQSFVTMCTPSVFGSGFQNDEQ